jgi:hypothetical protein
MSDAPYKDKGISPIIKSGNNRCFKCNAPIYFTSKEAMKQSGKPTKDLLTGRVIPLDPLTQDHHICKPEDIISFRETDQYKNRVGEWISKQQQKNSESNSSGIIRDSDAFSTTINDTANDNKDNINSTLEKILKSVDHVASELAAIKHSLTIGTDTTASSGEAKIDI